MIAPTDPNEAPSGPKRTWTIKANRCRKARWRGEWKGAMYCFEYDPKRNVIEVWRYRSAKRKMITMEDLIHALGGQQLLPL